MFCKVSILLGPENVPDAIFLQKKSGELKTEHIQFVLGSGYIFQF